MKLLDYYDLPKDVQRRFKKEHDEEMKAKYKAMGFDPNQGALKSDWEWKLKETFFFEESGNTYFSFKPNKI